MTDNRWHGETRHRAAARAVVTAVASGTLFAGSLFHAATAMSTCDPASGATGTATCSEKPAATAPDSRQKDEDQLAALRSLMATTSHTSSMAADAEFKSLNRLDALYREAGKARERQNGVLTPEQEKELSDADADYVSKQAQTRRTMDAVYKAADSYMATWNKVHSPVQAPSSRTDGPAKTTTTAEPTSEVPASRSESVAPPNSSTDAKTSGDGSANHVGTS